MKKIVSLIVLLVVFFTAMNATEVLVAQVVHNPFLEQARQQQAENQQRAIFVAVCAGVSIFCIIMGFYAYMKERDKKEREWREKQDEKNRELLAQQLRENKGSDPPDK